MDLFVILLELFELCSILHPLAFNYADFIGNFVGYK
ncbi:hypothetical protein Godav_002817 [Gossypium davidsonii]|uniref:Uncharacterized protein n=2 Tax=Gossypium TaxID=3633 RepID=A0A7J8SXC2_GOSDV|nr:hypothetical protein [Gossypium davidsonii]MBA0666472.1 hypothetical protein [Gossypium klotzschianum]